MYGNYSYKCIFLHYYGLCHIKGTSVIDSSQIVEVWLLITCIVCYSLLVLLCCVILFTQWLLVTIVSIAGNKLGNVIMRNTLGGAVQTFQWNVCLSVESTLLVRWWNSIVNNSVTIQRRFYHNNKMINLLSHVLLYRIVMNTDWLNCLLFILWLCVFHCTIKGILCTCEWLHVDILLPIRYF